MYSKSTARSNGPNQVKLNLQSAEDMCKMTSNYKMYENNKNQKKKRELLKIMQNRFIPYTSNADHKETWTD